MVSIGRLRTMAPWAVVVAVLGAGLTACGEERSPEAFCRVYHEEKSEYLAKYHSRAGQAAEVSETDPLAGALVALGSSVEALGDVVVIFDRLQKVAPEDIEPDVTTIRDSLKKQIDNAGDTWDDPLGGLANGIVAGLATSGSWQRVGEYVTGNCRE